MDDVEVRGKWLILMMSEGWAKGGVGMAVGFGDDDSRGR